MTSPAIIINVDAKQTLARLALSPAKISAGIARAIQKSAFLVERYAKIGAPVQTGRLRASIASDVSPTVAVIEPHVNYAIFVHEGTRYITANPFMTNAGQDSQEEIQRVFDDTMDEVARSI